MKITYGKKLNNFYIKRGKVCCCKKIADILLFLKFLNRAWVIPKNFVRFPQFNGGYNL